jgi:hypothetical protein
MTRFGERDHQEALKYFIDENKLKLLMIDPAYMCIPSRVKPENLFAMGELLYSVNNLCQQQGCQFMLAHHNKKLNLGGEKNPYAPPDLEDIAWTGFQEFARQWILVGRRSPYNDGTGEHNLWLRSGGSAGHSGLYCLKISEGHRPNRIWEVKIDYAKYVIEKEKLEKENLKEQTLQNNIKIIKTLLKSEPDTKKGTRIKSKIKEAQFDEAWIEIEGEGQLQPMEIKKTNRSYNGFTIK